MAQYTSRGPELSLAFMLGSFQLPVTQAPKDLTHTRVTHTHTDTHIQINKTNRKQKH